MNELDILKHACWYPRQVGHTHSAVHGLKGNDQAVMIVHSHQYGQDLAKQYDVDPKRFISMHDLDKLNGLRKPVIFEPHALGQLIEKGQRQVERETWERCAEICVEASEGMGHLITHADKKDYIRGIADCIEHEFEEEVKK